MRHLFIATAVATCVSLTSFAAFAADASSAGGFIHIGAGQVIHDTNLSSYFDGKRTLGFDLSGGYRWAVGSDAALGFELGAAHLGASEQFKRGSATRPTVKNGLGANAWLAGANVRWAMGDGFSLTGRAGVAHVHVRASWEEITKNTRSVRRARLSANTPYVGIGAGYALTEQADLTLQVTHYASTRSDNRLARASLHDWNATSVNLGIGYRF